MILDRAQLRKVTGKVHRKKQLARLVELGIQHKVRSDGEILVSEAHVERLLGGVAPAKVRGRTEPDWESHAATAT